MRANLASSWRGSWQSDWLTGPLTATFTQTDATLTGTVTVGDSFCVTQPVQVTGTVSGGTVNLSGYAPNGVDPLTVLTCRLRPSQPGDAARSVDPVQPFPHRNPSRSSVSRIRTRLRICE